MRGFVREKRLESLEVDYNSRLGNLSEMYNKIRDEIRKRDLKDVTTETLFKILSSIQENISSDILSPLSVNRVDLFKFNDNSWDI